MKKTRILQLHNLAIGPRPEDCPFPALMKMIEDERWGLLGNVDYLVVCGSFTRDRRPKSFRHARAVLHKMVNSFLTNGQPQANRVFLVPGPGDVPDPLVAKPNFRAFRKFYKDFYSNELLRPGMGFDPNHAELRVMKDLTLVGLSFWRSPDEDVLVGRARAFRRALDGIVRSLSQVPQPYVSATPTLLVSAGTPFFASESTWLPADAGAHGRVNSDLRITYHLIADGLPPILPAVPFSIGHYSLALRPGASPDSLWPLHANLIEIEGDPMGQGGRRGGALTVLRRNTQGTAWEGCKTEIAVPASWVPPAPETHVEVLYDDFSRTLASHLDQAHLRMIHVQGFPGSGLVDVFTWLTSAPWRQIGSHKVGVHGHRWESASGLVTFLQALPMVAEGSEHLIVLFDPTLEAGSNGIKQARVDEIVGDCAGWLEEGYRLLYLTGVIGTSLGPLASLIDDSNSIVMPLSAIENLAGTEFLHSYACRMPLKSMELDTLTGGYIGLSRRFLSACQETFGGWSGAHDIDERSSTLLLEESFQDPGVIGACSRFIESARQWKSSDNIFDNLRMQVLDRFAVEAAALNLSAEMEVELEGLAQAGTLRNLLLNHKVLGHVDADRYRIRVVAPFLVRREIRVFFSYHSEDRDYVERIRDLVELEAKRQYSNITINGYSLGKRPPEIASYRHDELMTALRESTNLCVFLVKQRDARETVISEINEWRAARQNRTGESRLTCVVPEHPALLPECLSDLPGTIPIYGSDDSQLASSLFRALLPSGNSWGFDVARPAATTPPSEATV